MSWEAFLGGGYWGVFLGFCCKGEEILSRELSNAGKWKVEKKSMDWDLKFLMAIRNIWVFLNDVRDRLSRRGEQVE